MGILTFLFGGILNLSFNNKIFVVSHSRLIRDLEVPVVHIFLNYSSVGFLSQPGVRQWSMEICLLLHLLSLLFCVFKYFKGISVPASHMVHFPNHLVHFKGECINHQRDFCGKCNSIYKVHWWCQLAVQIYGTAYHLQDFWTAHVY